ncbi:MAG: D-alanyl-lipoteichoic acid biosynthesis protein DltB [Tractidigestivibacter sp.]|jgi:membrane protein involved in D-alanine export|uniref:D-alanyl-lipoteichoic acid biosynthesis protein DltB n=1 Tax=Tractidigestivibacter sp. TaxID=2847320 RepID=UPI003D8F6506
MSFFADPSFYVLLVPIIGVAAALGLTEHPLRRYGLAVSILMVFLLFCETLEQGLAFLAFLALATLSTRWLLAKPDSGARYGTALALTLTPLVSYKLGSVFDQNLLGFSGVSYVTFKAIQVIIEVHGGLIKGMSFSDYLYFLVFFPTFTSGPIDRSRRFEQDARKTWTRDEYAGLLGRGLLLILAGMLYKLVVATLIHRSYSPQPLGDGTGFAYQLMCAYQYAGYLFFDFAGYSMMVMGVSYCLGIRTPRNFRAPFVAVDIKDFWNRWHITLSFWLRDFVFMRFVRFSIKHKLVKGRLANAQLGYLVNMLLMGFWHGVTIDYIAYGLFHGVLLALTERYQKKSAFYKAHKNDNWYRVLSWFVTMQLVVFSFAIFSGQISMLVEGALNG